MDDKHGVFVTKFGDHDKDICSSFFNTPAFLRKKIAPSSFPSCFGMLQDPSTMAQCNTHALPMTHQATKTESSNQSNQKINNFCPAPISPLISIEINLQLNNLQSQSHHTFHHTCTSSTVGVDDHRKHTTLSSYCTRTVKYSTELPSRNRPQTSSSAPYAGSRQNVASISTHKLSTPSIGRPRPS